MIRFYRKNRLTLKHAGSVVTALMLFVMYGTVAVASDAANTDYHMAKNSAKYNTKISINFVELTKESQKEMPANDNVISGFSLEDGAMEGSYGDGEYID